MLVLDLFSGIGGMSLGFERAGMKTVAFCEIGRQQQRVLKRHWPIIKIFDDATKTADIVSGLGSRPDVIAGGDPCPIRSRARSNGKSRHPDLSGYFLSLVGHFRPKWVVRENVLASDDADFATVLGVLGYRTAIVRTDAAPFTAQQRKRDFIVGANQEARVCFKRFISKFHYGKGLFTARLGERQLIPCLTTHRTRYDSRDCYIIEGNALRILDSEEREAFAGFPKGWLAGFSETACARMFGNAVVPQVAEEIGSAIVEASKY